MTTRKEQEQKMGKMKTFFQLIKYGFVKCDALLVNDNGSLINKNVFSITSSGRERNDLNISFCPITGLDLSGMTLSELKAANNGQIGLVEGGEVESIQGK